MPEANYVHDVESEFQEGVTPVWVLPPPRFDQTGLHKTIYILPAHPGEPTQLINVLQAMCIPEKYGVFVVVPSMHGMPWFGDHPVNLRLRQESYLIQYLIPFIENQYPVINSGEGRFLLGFSKSGWGAFSLILRNPSFFGCAASWDAPMFADHLFYGMDEVFGTMDHMINYMPSSLMIQNAAYFLDKTRLVLAGENLWGQLQPSLRGISHTQEMYDLMTKNGIKVRYVNSLKTQHTWSPIWIEPVIHDLMEL